jgi:hypothetical protein
MHHLITVAEQSPPETEQAAQIPEGADLPPDDIQVDKPQSVFAHFSLKHFIGGEDVDLPALGLCHVSEPDNHAPGAPEAGVADNVQ